MTQLQLIACTPVKPIPGLPHYPNTHYEKVACPSCKELMYLGPRSKAKHEAEGIPIVCMLCAVAYKNISTVTVKSLGGP